MEQTLQTVINLINRNIHLSEEEKISLISHLKETDKKITITEFKLERTEKVKRTTAILLEETIAELEQKRNAVEEQNRELEIESALERVRTVAMSMSKPDDLLNIGEILFKELRTLGFNELRNAIIQTFDDDKKYFNDYDFSDVTGGWISRIPYSGHPIMEKFVKNIRKNKDAFVETVVSGKEIEEWVKFRADNGEVDDPRLLNIQELFYYHYSVGEGDIGISTFKSISTEKQSLLRRFRNVFDLAYQRYTDIEKAEAQAREAKIEAALENIRSRSLAMHNSNELKDVIVVVFKKLKELELVFENIGIQLFGEGSKDIVQWVAAPGLTDAPVFVNLPYIKKDVEESEILTYIWMAKEGDKNFYNKHYSFEEKNRFFNFAGKYNNLEEIPEHAREIQMQAPGYTLSLVAEKHSALWIDSYSAQIISEEGFYILKRTAKVFEQAYIRFLDLQKAEAQTREAQIELGLERVRARAMAMQKSDELSELVDTVFKELTKLDFAINMCIINIIDESTLSNMVWAANPDTGKPPDFYHMKFEDYPFHHAMMKGYRERNTKFIYVIEGNEKKIYDEYLFNETEFRKMPKEAQAASKALKKYVSSFTFSNFGGLQTVGDKPLSDDKLDTLSRFGKVFDLTYTRFNDLQKAEAQALRAENDLVEIKTARKKAEEALTELKATQKQLIQSEKMASLGELTAGIAHEIQNPLNFVNNFSEVSSELADELKNAVAKNDKEEAIAIADDIKENLDKINHHGKRADAIVKGMLQHSRSSSGKKEPTDINALVDEYLRLSYHGLRAKDKSFNATMETHYDESLEKINIISQDVGRVILNLFTNAFYAVAEKKKILKDRYIPTVSVTTKRIKDQIEISVRDNGNGIPQKVVDKIFQPFFTTKPTGQGTGLGLSLSYDIVKAHGGEMKTNTADGEFAEFIVTLPII